MKPYQAFITILILLFMALIANAKKKMQDFPRAEIKVSYNYHEKLMRGNVEYAEHDIPMLLLANSNQSKFYSPLLNIRILSNSPLPEGPRQNRYLTSP